MTKVSWARVSASIGGGLLTIVLLACHSVTASAPPDIGGKATAVTVVTAANQTVNQAVAGSTKAADLISVARAEAAGRTVLWGKIWNCGCKGRDGADSVAAELETNNLTGDIKNRVTVGQYEYFTIAFDPVQIGQPRLEQAIKAAGGKVVAGPPASAL